jgi:hypothetical protein
MEKTFVLVEGPMGTKKPTTFVAMFDGEQLEVLGADSTAVDAAKQLERELDTAGSSFTLRKGLRGYTYYRKEFGKLTSVNEKEYRRRFPVSSKGTYQKSADAVLLRAASIRARAIGAVK